MCDEWMPIWRAPMTLQQFRAMPRNAAYKYELLKGQVLLTPRPSFVHAELPLGTWAGPRDTLAEFVAIRKLREDDWEPLSAVFRGAFHRCQPFASLDDATLRTATETCLRRTREGEDGPLLADACFHVYHRETDASLGAILITLVPAGDVANHLGYRWPDEMPPDQRTVGVPHVTWIFVSPMFQRTGIAEHLLDRSIRVLAKQGHAALRTTMLIGNERTLLWHWKMGFVLG